jgi:hypothetical protein
MAKPAATKKTRNTRKKVTEAYGSYIVEVVDWETCYSFTINSDDRFYSGSYGEHLRFEVKGILRCPLKFEGKDIQVTFLGSRPLTTYLNTEEYITPQPLSVGHLTIRGQQRDYIGSLPFDTVPVISSLLQAKQVRFISMSGKALFRGSASIDWINFMRDFDPEEW